MQEVRRGQNNILVFTLNEVKTLSSPYYLVKLVSRASRAIKRFILPAEQSLYTRRFNQFTITETSGTEILTSGIVTLTPVGDWQYEIYEQTSATNTNEALSDNTIPLEKGVIRVIGTDADKKYFDSQTKTNTYFIP